MKINVGVFFGGKSVEHEVSVITACEAMAAMDKNKYNVIPIYITKEGEFYTGEGLLDVKNYKDVPALLDKSTNINISVNEKEHTIINNESGLFMKRVIDKIDVAFPIMHGTNGEDGTLQGLFELMNIPYVGSNVLASANGMDKITQKMILKESGLPTVPFLWFFGNTYFDDKDSIINSIEENLGLPVIVKPANLGSSVGITAVHSKRELEEAIDTATSYSSKIIVEKFVENLRELNVSVLGDYETAYTSMVEEPLRSGDILSYNDKYAVGSKKPGSKGMAASFHKMPAEISEEWAQTLKAYAKMTFVALNCSGVARVDFLVNEETGDKYVNEINTIPGSLAYYFWEASGMPFHILIDKLIELAVKKHKEKNKLITINNINILSIKGKAPEKKEAPKKEVKTYEQIKEEYNLNGGDINLEKESLPVDLPYEKAIMDMREDDEIGIDEIKKVAEEREKEIEEAKAKKEIVKETEKLIEEAPVEEESCISQLSLSETVTGLPIFDVVKSPKEEQEEVQVEVAKEVKPSRVINPLEAIGAFAAARKETKQRKEEADRKKEEEKIKSTSIDVDPNKVETAGEALSKQVTSNDNPATVFKPTAEEILGEFENPDALFKSLSVKSGKKGKKKATPADKAAKSAALDELFSPEDK